MLAQKRFLGVICARGGSKGLPRKNVLTLGGKPLLSWSIIEGLKSQYLDELVVSSEDQEILNVAAEWGAKLIARPVELAQDDTPGTAPLLHAIEMRPDFDYAVLLQPTSPLRTSADIDGCIELAVASNVNSVVSVTPTEKSVFWTCTVDQQQRINFILGSDASARRRQELQATYVLNGAVYVVGCEWFRSHQQIFESDTRCYVMPRERSVDIDTKLDFTICEALIGSVGGSGA